MSLETTNPPTAAAAPAAHDAAASRGQQAWHRLGQRLRSITPAGIVRFLLITGALLTIGWLIWYTWLALIPFVVGGVIAYMVLPLVNRLDRVMPRFLAIVLALSLVIAVVLLFIILLIPILAEQIYNIYLIMPGAEEIRTYRQQLNDYLATLPEPTRVVINKAYLRATEQIQANLSLYLANLVDLVLAILLSLVNTVSFILGFLVVPAWLLSILHDQRQASPTLDRLLPAWLRADFWAVMRIIDRAFGAFIRGQLLTAVIVGLLTYGGLEVLVRLFGLAGNVRYQLLLAMIAGLMQLIPSIGPFLGAIPAILIGWTISPAVAVAILGLYFLVQQFIFNIVTPRVEQNIVDVHPSIFILILVSLSQFGFWWILLAAPVTAIIRDTFRYVYGRFSEPSRPPGLLPGEPLPVIVSRQTAPVNQRRRLGRNINA
ncbi:MAG TPA: AI-2E family transporter, partial [Anaerolineae bacterium]|nr:AI-2E family transporter [Anaerolineae bacterium]